jgi:hypothetical protein
MSKLDSELVTANANLTTLIATTSENKIARSEQLQASEGDYGIGGWWANYMLNSEQAFAKDRKVVEANQNLKGGFGNFLSTFKEGFTSVKNRQSAPIEQAKVVSGITPSVATTTPPGATSPTVANTQSTAATTQEGAAVKQTTAAEQNLMAAQANKEAAMANQQASIVFKAGADRLTSAPTPSVSYSFMPPSLGNQGR